MLSALVLVLALSAQGPAPTASQAGRPVLVALSAEESGLVAEAYAALARGDAATAALRAATLERRFPRSAYALSLTVEVEIARGNVQGALAVYEQRSQGKAFEHPLALRRIASAILVDTVNTSNSPSRLMALAALAEDGDVFALEALRAAAEKGSPAEAAALAAAGDPIGVKSTAAALSTPIGNKIALVEALGASGDRSAIPALVTMLNEDRFEHQAAAAEALGRLGARDQIPRLQALLKMPNVPPSLTMAAAAALLTLGDESGLARLQTWATSPVAEVRLAAAKALASRRDEKWVAAVQALTRESDPIVRIQAASLLAEADPATASAALDQLTSGPDSAVSALASQSLVQATSDLPKLRQYLRAAEALRVLAARRILEISR